MQQTLNIYGNSTEKIIYIYRDPRDVVVSASNYFPVQQPPSRLRNILFQLPFGLRIYRKLFFNENSHNSYKLDIFVKGLVEGTTFGSWLQTPWKSHVKDFISQKDILCISYESLKQDPLTQASRICNYLSLTRSSAELQAAIDTQSFQRKKKKFLEEG